jgi:hypothetical protein
MREPTASAIAESLRASDTKAAERCASATLNLLLRLMTLSSSNFFSKACCSAGTWTSPRWRRRSSNAPSKFLHLASPAMGQKHAYLRLLTFRSMSELVTAPVTADRQVGQFMWPREMSA